MTRRIVGAVVLFVAGTSLFLADFASAHYFRGQMTVAGNGYDPSTGKKGSVTVVGNTYHYEYCGSVGLPAYGALVPESAGRTYVDHDFPPASSIDVSVAPYADPRDAGGDYGSDRGSCTGQLPDGVYDVTFINGPAFTNIAGVRDREIPCERAGDLDIWVGQLTVVEGFGSGSYDLGRHLSPNTPFDESALCVTNQAMTGGQSAGYWGMQAPVSVV